MVVIIISKLVGMFRDIILANYFGTSNISDAYLIASSVPTLLFYFIGHSLATAYIPMYNKVKAVDGEEKAQDFSNNLLNISLVLSTVIVLVLLLFPGLVVNIFAVGFDVQTAKIAARLIRISAPSIYLMTIVYICSGYLQANKSFLAPAAISLPRNTAIVVSVILAASLGTDILGWGLFAAYILEFLFLLPFVIRNGYRYRPVISVRDEDITKTVQIVTPVLIGMCVSQINKIVDRSMASTIVEGGISALSYASIINNAVQEVLVTGIITILFASCSKLVAESKHEQVKEKLENTLNSILFLLVPASIGIIGLSRPIVELVLCRGEFNEKSLEMTVEALQCYTSGLLFMAVRDTLVKVFYAYKDTTTTTKTAITSIVLNIALNIILGRLIGVKGLALSTSISTLFNCTVLYVLLRKRIGDFGLSGLLRVMLKSLVGAVLMSMILKMVYPCLTNMFGGIVPLLITVFICCVFYFAFELLICNEPILNVVKRIKNRQ